MAKETKFWGRYDDFVSVESRCEICLNYLKDKSCKAYDKIPEPIWNNSVWHEEVRTDQKGNYIFE